MAKKIHTQPQNTLHCKARQKCQLREDAQLARRFPGLLKREVPASNQPVAGTRSEPRPPKCAHARKCHRRARAHTRTEVSAVPSFCGTSSSRLTNSSCITKHSGGGGRRLKPRSRTARGRQITLLCYPCAYPQMLTYPAMNWRPVWGVNPVFALSTVPKLEVFMLFRLFFPTTEQMVSMELTFRKSIPG